MYPATTDYCCDAFMQSRSVSVTKTNTDIRHSGVQRSWLHLGVGMLRRPMTCRDRQRIHTMLHKGMARPRKTMVVVHEDQGDFGDTASSQYRNSVLVIMYVYVYVHVDLTPCSRQSQRPAAQAGELLPWSSRYRMRCCYSVFLSCERTGRYHRHRDA
jgi:hypothetical protein